jgi:dethiobiotin synthetase
MRFAGPRGDRIVADCLYRYNDPVSPHLAAARDRSKVSLAVCLLFYLALITIYH